MPDITALSSQMSAAQFNIQYQAAVFNKIKDMQEIAGQAAIQLIQAAGPKLADPSNPVGQNVNIVV